MRIPSKMRAKSGGFPKHITDGGISVVKLHAIL